MEKSEISTMQLAAVLLSLMVLVKDGRAAFEIENFGTYAVPSSSHD
jgi:hypothetical protein